MPIYFRIYSTYNRIKKTEYQLWAQLQNEDKTRSALKSDDTRDVYGSVGS